MFTAVATLLDSKSYHGKSADAVYKAGFPLLPPPSPLPKKLDCCPPPLF